ncbi:hypothetical protein NEF87_001390 [Candidatus Lokiarchaeum ossiferum]|uniref:site-specific DNA-methyltransferase (adenine-specific) n=1 Tax=Candidatus Lokiarchaeum ossiferum TaxID=2951803 RepID=A0ABY6HNK8_9ARCH|nr:hypothetical protein NEF87_001390 [Candidatus Lokiarchaeum sp. B-35]
MNFDSLNLLKEHIIGEILSLLNAKNFCFPEELKFEFDFTDEYSLSHLESKILQAANLGLFENALKAFSLSKFQLADPLKIGTTDPLVSFIMVLLENSENYVSFLGDAREIEGLNLQLIQNYYHYQLKYQFRLKWNFSEQNFTVNPHKTNRKHKEKGIFYTADSLCEKMVNETLGTFLDDKLRRLSNILSKTKGISPLVSNSPPINAISSLLDDVSSITICDPSMGTGAFLRASFTYLCNRRHEFCTLLDKNLNLTSNLSDNSSLTMFFDTQLSYKKWERHILTHMLYGVDLDGFAQQLASKILVLSSKQFYPDLLRDFTPLNLNFRYGDAVISPTISPAFISSIQPFKFDIEQLVILREKSRLSTNSKQIMSALKQLSLLKEQILAQYYAEMPTPYHDIYMQNSFSWILEFPEIFSRTLFDITEKHNGFDIILNNPPWEMNQINDNEFFNSYYPNFADLAVVQKKKKKLQLLNNELISKNYFQYIQLIKSKNDYWKHFFHLQGENKLNLYKLFLERILSLGNSSGYCSIIIPAGLLGEERANRLRIELVERTQILHITLSYTGKDFFPNIAAGMPLIVLTFHNSGPTTNLKFAFFNARNLHNDDHVSLSLKFLQQISPNFHNTQKFLENSFAIPLITHHDEKDLIMLLHQYPTLAKGWGFDTKRELNRTDDEKNGVIQQEPSLIPVLEGKYLVHYGYSISAVKYFIAPKIDYKEYKPIFQYERIVWRNVSNIQLRRRLFFAIIPSGIATVNSLNYITPYRILRNGHSEEKKIISRSEMFYLLGLLGSLVAEYWIRLFSTNNNVNQYLVKSIPLPFYESSNPLHEELIFQVTQFQNKSARWADQMVQLGRDYRQKNLLEQQYWADLAQIDALVFKIYCLNIKQIKQIFDRFPKIAMVYKKLVIQYFQNL